MSLLMSVSRQGQANADAVNRLGTAPDPEPGFFSGITSDPEQVLDSLHQGIVVQPAILGSLAVGGALRGIDKLAETDLTDQWLEATTEPLLNYSKSLHVNPKTSGTAAQILDLIATIIPQAVLGGPAGVGLTQGFNEALSQVDQGIDAGTALDIGAVTGAVNAIGVAIPAAVGTNLIERLASGAFSNAAIGAYGDYAKHETLADAGYEKQAEQYVWNDARHRTIDIVLGTTFSAFAHIGAKKLEQQITDAALIINEARNIDNISETIPTNAADATRHVEEFNRAYDDLNNGIEPLQTNPIAGPPDPRIARNEQTVADLFPPEHTRAGIIRDAEGNEFATISAKTDLELQSVFDTILPNKKESDFTLESQKIVDIVSKNETIQKSVQDQQIPVIQAQRSDVDTSLDTPEYLQAKQYIDEGNDGNVFIENDDGTTTSSTYRQLLEESDIEIREAPTFKQAFQSAITCFLKFGDAS